MGPGRLAMGSTPRYVLGLLLPSRFGVIGAKVGRKLFVTLPPEVFLHLIERCAQGRIGRFEPPATFGATKPPKTLLLNPYQLPHHGHLGCSAPTSSCLLSMDETCRFGIYGSFCSDALPDSHRTPSASLGWWTIDKSMGKVNRRRFEWSVGNPTNKELLRSRGLPLL